MLKGYTLTGLEKLEASKEKLVKSCISKMKTIMIGAIADIEGIDNEEFERIRKNILDRGNNLIRAFEAELNQYDINYRGEFTIFKRDQ